MLFKLGVLRNDKAVTWYLNNLNLNVYNEYQDLISTTDVDYSQKHLIAKEYNRNTVSPISLTVFVGYKCNYHCEYCPQAPYRSMSHDAHIEDVPRLKTQLSSIDLSKVQSVIIMGGEPFVYWKAIKEFVVWLKQSCPNLSNFRIMTNGSLLTDEIVEYCHRYRIRIVVSDDGGENVHRKNDNTQDRFLKYNRWASILKNKFAIRYLLGKHNLDDVTLYEYFKKQIPNLKVISNHSVIRSIFPNDAIARGIVSFNRLTINELRLVSDSRYELLLRNTHECKATRHHLERVVHNLKTRFEYNQTSCSIPYGKELVIDFAGNILRCLWFYNDSSIAGNLNDLSNVDLKGYIPIQERKNCSRCPLVALCRGICPLSTQSLIDNNCALYYADKLAYFKAAFKKLWGVDILGIYPIEGEPLSIMKPFNDYLSNYEEVKHLVNWSVK